MKHKYLLTGLLACALAVAGEDQAPVLVDMNAVRSGNEILVVDGIAPAGQPDAAVLAAAAEAGFEAVIDLRGEDENRGMDEAAVVEELGMSYVNLPLSGAASINRENAARLDALLAEYDGPILLHCGSGNRVGAILALRQSLKGADDDAALAYGKSAGLTRLEPVVRERLEEE